MTEFLLSMKELIATINSMTIGDFPQLFLNVIFSGGLFYWIQRKHKRNDDFIIEKNKRLVDKHVDCESQLFSMMNIVKIGNINDQTCVDLSTTIKNFTILNYLYISEELLRISNEFSDYLLEISVDMNTRDIKKEHKLIKKFKSEFKK